MLLKFVSPHLSITPFEPVELPNLCVITGINGSGKSHLLQAIANGNVRVDNIRAADIVLFNGETFRLDNQSHFTVVGTLQERENAWQFLTTPNQNPNIIQPLQSFKSNLAAHAERLKEVAQAAYKPLWKLDERDGLSTAEVDLLENYKTNLQDFLLNHQNLRGNHQAQSIYALAKKISFFVDEITRESFFVMYEPRHFRENFLPIQLSLAFTDYYSKWEENEYNEYRNAKGGNYPFLEPDEFVRRHGPKPWDVINQVLSQLGTIPYRVNSPEGLDRAQPFRAELIHQYKPDVNPNFGDLSSGEKILIALVASVYKASSDRNFPKLLLLDEIDASLHPSMMQSMLQIIQDVFIENGVSTILVTHSPTTVAIFPEESIFVMRPQGEKRVEHQTRATALDILTEGFVTLTKGLTVLDEVARTKVAVVTEGKNAELIARALEIAAIKGIEVVSGVEDRSGAQQLKTLFDFFGRLPHDGKIVVVWDCDAAKFRTLPTENNTHAFVFEPNQANALATRGIENLFPEHLLAKFQKQITWADGTTKVEFDDNKKSEFARFVLDRNDPSDFDLFKPLVDFLKTLAAANPTKVEGVEGIEAVTK